MNTHLVLLILTIVILLNILGLYLVTKIKVLNIQPIKFLGVGTLNTFNYMFIFTLLNINLNYLVAHITVFIISSFISYFLTTIYTFSNKVSVETALKFPLTFLPNLIMSSLGAYLLVTLNIMSDDVASTFMMLLSIPVTFFVGKFLLSPKNN
ncbi:MAG: GtrA family protein [Mycoplasmatales bacterium]